ncbi:MAG TPA: hypothetical protein VJI15_04675 [Candidatus Nanoarchaeia archaeon]|nr:hypothetical protein [Candidatus Nanoarchaeia archaeon]
MAKKCIICNAEAVYKIKDTSDYYCKDCAQENFSDISMLMSVEEEAQKLKSYLKEKIEDVQKDEEELDQFISEKGKKGGPVSAENGDDDEDDEDDDHDEENDTGGNR